MPQPEYGEGENQTTEPPTEQALGQLTGIPNEGDEEVDPTASSRIPMAFELDDMWPSFSYGGFESGLPWEEWA